METVQKPVVYSEQFFNDVSQIFQYGFETFGSLQAANYEERIYRLCDALNFLYDMYPECRHLITKNRIYHNIILDSHLIIYRIKPEKIEVLRVLHSHASITKIRSSRSTKT
jgi:toxin ParE1/3/4